MRRIAHLLISIILLIYPSACNKSNGDFDLPPYNTISIAHLKSMAIGSSRIIADDIAIEGYILANDLFGEFYKSIILCDDSGGIEILVDTENSAVEFPVFTHLTVFCSSLYIGNYGGKIELGTKPTGAYNINHIAKSDFTRFFKLDKTNIKDIKAQRVTIDAITPRHSGNYIRLEDVTFGTQAGMTWCDTAPENGHPITTERTISDRDGNTLVVRVLSHYAYGNKKIPSGYGTIQGVVEYFNNKPSLRIVNNNYDF